LTIELTLAQQSDLHPRYRAEKFLLCLVWAV